MSYRVPNVNASLIREIRMVVQQFFRHKEDVSFWQSRAPKPPASELKCGKCMEVTSKPMTAVTIYNGTALCQTHANVAMIPDKRSTT